MSDILEKSLDEIIGENKSSRPPRSQGSRNGSRRGGAISRRTNRPRGGPPGGARRPRDNYRPSNPIPLEIQDSAAGRPILRVKNIHPELNGADLSNLFQSVAPVEFVKFDPRKDSIAYVCFQYNYAENNSEAITKFDGKRAMGKILIVENATSLADRIALAPSSSTAPADRSVSPSSSSRYSQHPYARNSRGARPAPRQRPKRSPRPHKKSAEELDDELNAYMSGKSDEQLKEEARLSKLDNQLDDYWKNGDGDAAAPAPNAPAPGAPAPEVDQDSMNID